MRLLFDENLSHRLVVLLATEYPASLHVRDVGLSAADDQAVWTHAAQNGLTIVSKDSDFQQRALLYGHPPKVIWVRLEATREFLPVAELVVTKEGERERFEFAYLQGVQTALQQGFQPFLAFPDIDRCYAGSQLFPFFQNRVLPTTRPDYLEYVSALGMDRSTANVIDLLGRSEGRRHTDRIETVLAAERHPETGRYVTRFLVRGVRHVAGAEDVIRRLRAGGAGDGSSFIVATRRSRRRRRRCIWGR